MAAAGNRNFSGPPADSTRIRDRIKRWLRSDALIAITILTLVVALISGSIFNYFGDNLGNSFSFGITTAALFAALMVFRIQTYPKPNFSLNISMTVGTSGTPYVDVSLIIENKGISTYKTQLTFSDVQYIQLSGICLVPNSNLYGSKMTVGKKPYALSLCSFVPYDKQIVERTHEQQTRPDIKFEFSPHGHLMKYIMNTEEIYFSPSDVEEAVNKTLEKIKEFRHTSYWGYAIRVQPSPLSLGYQHGM